MNYILFDDSSWHDLLPLTYTRPVAEMRVGIMTLAEKWNRQLGVTCSYLTQDYLQEKFPLHTETRNTLINGGICPDVRLLEALKTLQVGQVLAMGEVIVAGVVEEADVRDFAVKAATLSRVEYREQVTRIGYAWDVFRHNGTEIERDFEVLTRGRVSQPVGESNRVLHPENIFIEEGATVLFATLNASQGPIYIGKDAEVMEGSMVRGPFALCEHSTLKMGAKIYGPTTFGPHCKVGGEVSNSVMFGYSNKAHDGFLGNSVLGEWCNLGADTNNSNLKNNYEEVKLWNYAKERFVKTGLQFCGLVMGDHSKSGINTMFNTGTVIGVSCNLFGDGFPRNFVPSFSWGGAAGLQVYAVNKATDVAARVYERRSLQLGEVDRKIFEKIFEMDSPWRNY